MEYFFIELDVQPVSHVPGTEVQIFSNELHVSERTPPIFIAVASDDKCVSPQNSILFNEAMVAQKRSAALHVYPSGDHGFVCRFQSEYRRQALDDLSNWLNNRKQE